MFQKRKAKILIIDDQEDTFLLFQQHFKLEIENNEFDFVYASSSKKTLNLLYEQDLIFNLVIILSDIDLEEFSGLELLKIIKEKTPQMPLFMLIAYGDEKSAAKALEMGADEILVKPINFLFLKNLILETLKLKTGNDDDKNSCCG